MRPKLVSECGLDLGDICLDQFGPHWRSTLPTGALIGMVNLVGCEAVEGMPIGHQSTDDYHCGDFSTGRFAWRRAAFKRFAKPIPYKGKQGFFFVPDEVVHDTLAEAA
jgi:hypothetical protein